MAADPKILARRVADQTQNDPSLIETAAVEIARALNLEGNNRTLGRKFVRIAVSSKNFEAFQDMSKEYASLPVTLQRTIYDSVKHKYDGILAQMQQENGDNNGDSPPKPGTIMGFSGKTESLLRTSENITKGGLIKKDKHIYSRPEGTASTGREHKTSALGLDKLAKLKQVSMAASQENADDGDEINDEEFARRSDEMKGMLNLFMTMFCFGYITFSVCLIYFDNFNRNQEKTDNVNIVLRKNWTILHVTEK